MIQIGDNRFDVPPPPAMRTFALQQRILPVAGRVVNVFLQLLGAGTEITNFLEADIIRVLPIAMPAIGEIFAAMPPNELETITRELLGKATYEFKGNQISLFGSPGGGDAFDVVMRGKTMDIWKLLWHALEVWYPDFFARARGLFAASAKVANRSEGSNTSATSGQDGAS